MNRRFLHILGPLFGLLLFVTALAVLHHELKVYHLQDIFTSFRGIPAHRIFLALFLTFLSYLVMTGYDALALKFIRHPLTYGKIALASFIGYAFSNNIGLSMIAGASVRYRLYSAWGLTAFEIAEVVTFCTLTLWLGFFTIAGLIFLIEPMVLPEVLHLPFASTRMLGMALLGLVTTYFLWSVLRKRPLRIREWEFPLPSSRHFVLQITIASIDWILAGTVLYALMPSFTNLPYPGFIGVYMMAQLAGLISQVPGGLGVFETGLLLLLSSHLPASEILGTLLAYRAMYYLTPLGVAVALLGSQEVIQKKAKFQQFVQVYGRRLSGVVPQVLSLAVFVSGAILLFSGATPAIESRLHWLKNFFPLPVLEISHFLGSLVGVGLLLLARGLHRRLDGAYLLTLILLSSGIGFSLLKGLDYEEAIILSVMLAALLPCRRHFYRKASLLSERFNFGWIAAIILVIVCAIWLGLFSYKHVTYSGELWWHFTFLGHAPRFLRATVGVVGFLSFFAAAKLLRPGPPKLAPARQEELEKVVSIVRMSPYTYANLALLGDKSFLVGEKGNAFIMYGVEGGSWISMGDPVGKEEEWAGLIWEFREMCDHYDGWTVFYEVGSERLPLYVDLGLSLLKLGEEARIPIQEFSLEGSTRKGLRHTHNKLEREGCIFEVVQAENIPSLFSELRLISDAWLKEKNTREKGFSLGYFDTEYLKRFPLGIVRKEDKILAFANIWQGAQKEELSIDLMRHTPDSPHSVMDYLFIELMLWGRQEGYRWFNLGMAPFSGLKGHELGPLWSRLGDFIFRHGEHFYNLQGLRQYKEKFDPVWSPKYLACPGGLVVPRILTNIASLISGGMKGVIAK